MKMFSNCCYLLRGCRWRHWSSSNLDDLLTTIRNRFQKIAFEHSPPVTLPRPGVPVHVQNQIIQDDFSWLQDLNCKQVKKIIADENRFTAHVMRDTTSFQKVLVKKISKLQNQTEELVNSSLPVHLGNFVYYTKESGNYPCLVMHCRRRKGTGHQEEVIFDEASVTGDWNYIGVKSMKVSPSEKFVAFVIDTSGSDTYCGILIDMSKNPGKISDQLPCANLEWDIAGHVLYYTTFDHLKRADKVWRHAVGNDPSCDELIFEEKDTRFYVDVSCTKDRRFITINSNSKSTSEVHILDATAPDALPRLVRQRETGIEYYVEHHHGTFYILTNLPDGENYQVMTADGKILNSKNWTTIVPSSDETRDTVPRLSVLSLAKPSSTYMTELSDSSSVLSPGYNLDFNSTVVKFTTSSPIQPPTLMELNLETNEMKNSSNTPSGKSNYFEFSHYCRSQIKATSKDGTKVPITLFHRRDIELQGKNPILIHVYGSYGMNVNMDFTPEKLHLLSRDWILAFCHVRGGGELGRRWYHMGRMKNKSNCFEDFEACVRMLHKQGYSSPRLTAVRGTSAGGLPVAVLCNNTPHLVKAAILKVPFVDVMSAMLDEDLALTAQEFEEFGNPRLDVDVFTNLKSFCPYLNISNQDYPNMLFTSSVHDIRVPFWMPLKFVAKLRHIQATNNPSNPGQNLLLLKTDFESGHFGAGTVEELLVYLSNDITSENVMFFSSLTSDYNIPRSTLKPGKPHRAIKKETSGAIDEPEKSR